MSVRFNHKVGQHGNQLFVCIKAAIVAITNNLHIDMPTNGLVTFKHVMTTAKTVADVADVHLKRGYYQDVCHFNPYKHMIVNDILDLPKLDPRSPRDVVMHVRLDGFNHEGHNSHIIAPEWYTSILDTLDFDTLYIVMDTKSGRIWRQQATDKKKYLDAFAKYSPTVVSGTAREDFEFIRSFDTIVCSNSTFSFWATFLSDASRKFMPPFWESKRSRLSEIENAVVVHEHYGYVNIHTMEPVKITFQ